MIKLPLDIFHHKGLGIPFKMIFKNELEQKVIVHPKARGEMQIHPVTGFKNVFYDEDGYALETIEEVKAFNMRMKKIDKKQWLNNENEETYNHSKWGKEVVSILQAQTKSLQNTDIMQLLYEKGYDGNAMHFNQFFKSKDGKRFYQNELINDKTYWTLKRKGSKGVSIPIMITNKMRMKLLTLGYTRDEMKYLTSIECHDIINNGVPKKPSRERGRNQ